MTVPTKILELVKRFDRNLDAYKQGKYNETQIRREFIDPFFEELGWDSMNKQRNILKVSYYWIRLMILVCFIQKENTQLRY